jgi:hypothetical protein
MARRKTQQNRTVTAVTNDDEIAFVDGSIGDIVDAVTTAVRDGVEQAVGKTTVRVDRIEAKVDRHYRNTHSSLGVVKANAKLTNDRLRMVERTLADHMRTCGDEHAVEHVVRHQC